MSLGCIVEWVVAWGVAWVVGWMGGVFYRKDARGAINMLFI